ncbi:hypothetical protein AB4865_06860 [Capnocytophaga sp. ARDL2]|uniref:hypothetical protein n=1 Tax=Capnocytophaga sp. ARDL2 TaxID=3238809 RepID=UPI003556DAE3
MPCPLRYEANEKNRADIFSFICNSIEKKKLSLTLIMGCLKITYQPILQVLRTRKPVQSHEAKVVQLWLNVDPLVEVQPNKTSYHFVSNNPINRVDPTGMLDNPIYDTDGNFLGTDDKGLQGKAIVMNKKNFTQGMSHQEALSYNLGAEELNKDGIDKLLSHYNGLKDRPDYDGGITLDEANDWYRNGKGEPLFTSLEKIDLSGILSLGEKYVGQVKTFNLLLNSSSLNDGLVYGNITLKRYPNHSVRAYADEYNFEMHNTKNPLNWARNVETIIGRKVAGEGKSFEINIYGNKNLTPILPWIR